MTSTLTATTPREDAPALDVGRLPVHGALPVAVVGLGGVLPPTVITNDQLADVLDTSDEWIASRTGIRQRHWVSGSQTTSSLATEAARRALASAGVEATALGAIIVATTTPDTIMPATAPVVADGLGVTSAGAFDVNAACSGFVHGLAIGASMVVGLGRPVLVIGAETLSRIVDPSDRTTAPLFGDGAGAVVLAAAGAHATAGAQAVAGADVGAAPQAGSVGPFDLGADGSLAGLLTVPGGGTRRPLDASTLAAGEQYLRMQGREVYRHAVTRMVASSRAVLAAAGLAAADIDLVVGHQANARILQAVADRLGVPADRNHLAVDRHGNTSAASIPLALLDAHQQGRLASGSRVLLTAFGAGLTWSSALLTWSGDGPSVTVAPDAAESTGTQAVIGAATSTAHPTSSNEKDDDHG